MTGYRKRWVYTSGGRPLPEPIEVSDDWENVRGESHRSEEEIFGKLTNPEGGDMSSRKKMRDYMKANDLAHHDDFKEHFAKKEVERRAMFTPGSRWGAKERKEDVARALYQHKEKNRNKR